MKILVTGGVGYIGSHTVVDLIENGHDIVILDNLCNSKIEVLDKIKEITGKAPAFMVGDIRNRSDVDNVFNTHHDIDAVIHFAGLKAVGESCEKPLLYYDNNIAGTVTLLKSMSAHGCKRIVFSSSATVYGDPATVPVTEDFPLSTTNPYGSTKLYIEQILKDLCASDSEWDATLLRYFNPVGAHESTLLGENPNGIPNNLMPYIMKVACGKLEKLHIFGDDYPTADGTGVRDYIHVCDLAHGHTLAISKLDGLKIYNLGTGTGYSVLDMVKAFEKANNIKLPYCIDPRRPGDVAVNFADPAKAKEELGFEATRTLEDMCRTSYEFAKKNFK
ncbi:MAG: UDP-glucose 4-epimerase GalE [Clostridia bacterium]|nr:UDP-glucose 4-epimerase GalE [Clostridia bacterium]